MSRQPPAFLFAAVLGDSLPLGFVGAESPAAAAPLFVGRKHFINMNISEFKREPDWKCWVWHRNVASPFGDFKVQLRIEDSKQMPPGEEMITRAQELVTYAQSHGDYILDLVFGSYKFRLQHQGDIDWMGICEVPSDLTRDTVAKYVASPTLFVRRDFDDPDTPYNSYVFFLPQWDEEHGLEMRFEKGAIVAVDDTPFKLQDGVLQFEDEEE